MKRVLIFSFFLPFLFASCKKHVYISLTQEYLSTCQNRLDLCTPIEIVRKHPSYKYVAYFKTSYNVTSINLMDSSYLHPNVAAGVKSYIVKSIRNYQINPNTEFSIDLTGVPDGIYFTNIYGSKTGYIFPIKLLSKP